MELILGVAMGTVTVGAAAVGLAWGVKTDSGVGPVPVPHPVASVPTKLAMSTISTLISLSHLL